MQGYVIDFHSVLDTFDHFTSRIHKKIVGNIVDLQCPRTIVRGPEPRPGKCSRKQDGPYRNSMSSINSKTHFVWVRDKVCKIAGKSTSISLLRTHEALRHWLKRALHTFIHGFLANRKFRVQVGNSFFSLEDQWKGSHKGVS